MDAGSWDFEKQKAETQWVFDDILSKTQLHGGEAIVLDLDFVLLAEDGDKAGFVKAVENAGYSALEGQDGQMTVSVKNAWFTADSIWSFEEAMTHIALKHGYRPDGWGFLEP